MYNFEIDVNQVANTLYTLVADKMGTDIENIRIIYAGRIINKNEILSSNNIINGSVLYASLRKIEVI